MKRRIEIYVNTPFSSTLGGRWTLTDTGRGFLGFSRSEPMISREVVEKALKFMRSFGCERPLPDSTWGFKYLSESEESEKFEGGSRQFQAILYGFNDDEIRVINHELTGSAR